MNIINSTKLSVDQYNVWINQYLILVYKSKNDFKLVSLYFLIFNNN